MMQPGGNLHSCNQRHFLRLFYPTYRLEHTTRRNGNHHHGGRLLLAFDRLDCKPKRVAQDQLFQAHARAEFQDRRTESTDGAPRDLQHPRPLLVDPQFCMYGTFTQVERCSCTCYATGNFLLHLPWQLRRRYIDCLFKKGTIQRIGLVEERQYLQLPMRQDTLQGYLEAGDEILDQDRSYLFRVALGKQQPFQAIEGYNKFLRVIGPYNTSASGEAQRFHHTRKSHLCSNPNWIVAKQEGTKNRARCAACGH